MATGRITLLLFAAATAVRRMGHKTLEKGCLWIATLAIWKATKRP
jgi:hypothetical protein